MCHHWTNQSCCRNNCRFWLRSHRHHRYIWLYYIASAYWFSEKHNPGLDAWKCMDICCNPETSSTRSSPFQIQYETWPTRRSQTLDIDMMDCCTHSENLIRGWNWNVCFPDWSHLLIFHTEQWRKIKFKGGWGIPRSTEWKEIPESCHTIRLNLYIPLHLHQFNFVSLGAGAHA